MKKTTLALCCSLALTVASGAALAKAPSVNGTGSQTVMSAEESQLQAQIIALAQAGNLLGVDALVRTKLEQGKADMLARVAKRMAVLATQIAGTDTTGAASLVNFAVIIASNSDVAAADSTVGSVVGTAAQGVVTTVQNTDLYAASEVQKTVAMFGSRSVQVSFATPTPQGTGANNPNNQQSTTTTTGERVVNPPRVIDTSEPPVISEPNPPDYASPT